MSFYDHSSPMRPHDAQRREEWQRYANSADARRRRQRSPTGVVLAVILAGFLLTLWAIVQGLGEMNP